MPNKHVHLIASKAEKENAARDIRDYLEVTGQEAGLWFDRSADPAGEAADSKALFQSCDLSNLGRVNPEADVCLLLSVYDLDIVRLLYQHEIRNILCLAEPAVWIGPDDKEKAEELEKKYLLESDFRSLKKLNRINMIFSYLLRETVMRSFPVQLQIETTSFCNAQCIMCGHYIHKNVLAKHMNLKMLEELDEYLKYTELVILHGYGEPFLQPAIEEHLKKYQAYGIKVATNTNLSVLPDSILQMMPELFSEITVSIDGCTKDVYEGIRKGLSFETLLHNIDRLNSAAPDLPKKIAMVIMRQNLHQIPEMIRFAKSHGFSAVDFIAMGSSVFAENQNDEVWNYPNVLRKQLGDASAEADMLGIKCEMPLPYNELQKQLRQDVLDAEWEDIRKTPFFPGEEKQKKLYEQHVVPRLKELEAKGIADNYSRYTSSLLQADELLPSAGSRHYTGCCDSIIMRPFINLDGRVFACCIHTKQYTGEMNGADSLGNVWNSEGFRRLRSLFYNGTLPAYCDHCSFMDNQFLVLVRRKNEEEI